MNKLILSGIFTLMCSYVVLAQAHIELDPPPAVDISDRANEQEIEINPNAILVSNRASLFETTNLDLSEDLSNENVSFSLVGARLVSEKNPLANIKEDVYFIQLAALFNSRGDVNVFTKFEKYGNLYKQYEQGKIKIKLGFFRDRIEAQDILRIVKSSGFYDAFITVNKPASSNLELVRTADDLISAPDPDTRVYTGGGSSSSYSTPTPSVKKYKVRVASYTDPMWFSSSSVEDLGTLEQWSKGDWTIFVLGTYDTYQEAESIRIQSMNRGFSQAEVVVDNNGVLEKAN